MFCLIVGSSCTQSIPSSSTAYVIGSVLPEPRMIAETLMFQPTVCVPTGICSRRLQIADPRLIELRAWSRLAEELQEERVRLSNRLHQQLWRYYPQMLKLTDDLTATWLLELWLKAPTPAKAARLRVSAVERLLKKHRIRRVNAEVILRTLRQPAIKVSDGVAAAAGIHIHSFIVRLQLVSRELNDAKRK